MRVTAVFENGVFRPLERPHIPERQRVVIEYWPEAKPPQNLAAAYEEASQAREDMEDWSALDTEGWE